jgi:AcrR family transcriptional regulator
VIDAVVDLLHEGFAPPATADVTERAGVSEATLFRYFESIDDLQLQATERFLATHAHLFEIPREGVGDRSARIDRFVKARSTLWATIAPVARLGRARAFDHPGMDAFLRSARRSQYEQIARHFAPELAERSAAGRDDLVAAIATLTSFEAFDVQWRDLERTPTQVRRAWRTALRALLGDTADTTPAGSRSDEADPPTRAPSGSSRP